MLTNVGSFKLLLSLACISAIPLATGCLANTVVGTSDGGSTSAATSSGGAGGGGGASSNTIALRYDELPALGSGGGTSAVTSVGTGGGPAPDTLFVELDSGPLSCGDPYGSSSPAHWHVSIALPTAYQAVGTYPLSNSDIISVFSEFDASSGTGGSFVDGTVEVVSINASSIHVKLENTNASIPADGDYVIPRCGAGPAPEAIALRYDQFPPPDPTGSSVAVTTGGSGPDPATLFVIVGQPVASCGDPFAVDCSIQSWQVSVGLPPAYQAPGTYSLNDPALLSSFSESGPDEGGDCAGGGGSFFEGTITVDSIDASSLVVHFDGVSDYGATLEQAINVSRCP